MRRAELEGIRTRADEISAHISDAHQKLGAILTVQEKLPSILDCTATIGRDIEQLETRMNGVRRTESDLAELEQRLEALVSASREHHAAIAERTTQLEALTEELNRGGSAPGTSFVADLCACRRSIRKPPPAWPRRKTS